MHNKKVILRYGQYRVTLGHLRAHNRLGRHERIGFGIAGCGSVQRGRGGVGGMGAEKGRKGVKTGRRRGGKKGEREEDGSDQREEGSKRKRNNEILIYADTIVITIRFR